MGESRAGALKCQQILFKKLLALRKKTENLKDCQVHTSNYRFVAFHAPVSLPDLSALAREHGLPLIEDLGSGSLMDFSAQASMVLHSVFSSVASSDVEWIVVF